MSWILHLWERTQNHWLNTFGNTLLPLRLYWQAVEKLSLVIGVDAARLLCFQWGVIRHWGWLPQAVASISHIILAQWISHHLIYNWNWTNNKCVPLWTARAHDCVTWHQQLHLGSCYQAEILQWGANYLGSPFCRDDVIFAVLSLCPTSQRSALSCSGNNNSSSSSSGRSSSSSGSSSIEVMDTLW